jgi:hypothetical protein
MGDALYYNYHLQTVGASFPVLISSEEPHNFAVAFIGDTYKTVGSTLDFGGMVDGESPSTKKILLAKILEFFDVEVVITGTEDWVQQRMDEAFSIFPNPADREISLRILLDQPGPVSVSIYSLQGKKLLTVADHKNLPAGTHILKANTESLQAGIYLCKWTSERGQETKRLIISK